MAYTVPDHILHSKLDDEITILNLKNGEYYSLNETGAFIWLLICDGINIDHITAELSKNYDNENRDFESDLMELIEELKLNGLVEES